MRACDRMARRSTCFHGKSTMTQRGSTRFAHIRTVLTLAHCLSCMIQHQCFDARHALGSASCLPHACTTLHDTTSHPFHTARSCFALPCVFLHSIAPFQRARSNASWCMLLLARFCSRFCLFLFFCLSFVLAHLAGSLGNFCFCAFLLPVPPRSTWYKFFERGPLPPGS